MSDTPKCAECGKDALPVAIDTLAGEPICQACLSDYRQENGDGNCPCGSFCYRCT